MSFFGNFLLGTAKKCDIKVGQEIGELILSRLPNV